MVQPFAIFASMSDLLWWTNSYAIIISFLWTHYCWPTQSLVFKPLRGRMVFILKSILVALALNLLSSGYNRFAFSYLELESFGGDISFVISWQIILVTLLLLLGNRLRRRYDEQTKPDLGTLPVLALICFFIGNCLYLVPWSLIDRGITDASTIHSLGLASLFFLISSSLNPTPFCVLIPLKP